MFALYIEQKWQKNQLQMPPTDNDHFIYSLKSKVVLCSEMFIIW